LMACIGEISRWSHWFSPQWLHVRDSWWTKWHYRGALLQLSFHYCLIVIYQCTIVWSKSLGLHLWPGTLLVTE
jgi:hypothetical protein